MAIKVPGKRYGKRLSRSKVFGSGPSGGKGPNNVELNMTPLVDMFVIMVLFLIANFSATGEIINQSNDIELPEAKHVEGIQLTTVIRVSMTDIYVETDRIAKIDEVLGEEYLNIPALEEKLRTVKADYEKLHATTGKEFTGDINIQAHKDLSFNVMKRIMYSAAVAGYGNINFAVNGTPPEEGVAAVTP